MHMMRLVFWAFAALLLVGAYFTFNPLVYRSDERMMMGSTITLESISDFLIVVDYEEFSQTPSSFGEMSFSLAWLNSVQQEIGPVTHIDATQFVNADLTRYRAIILTKSASHQDAWAPKLRSFLERGGTLILEMPQGALRTIASADGLGGVRTAQNVTYAAGLDEPFLKALAAVDLSSLTQVIGSAGPLEGSETFLTIDGVPVIYAKNYAVGRVITVDFNYGMMITALQQGRPLDDFHLRNMRDSAALETSDLALAEHVSTELPLADLMERFFFYGVLDASFPVVGFWPFFDGLDGALIVTHQAGVAGDKANWMAQYEASFRATSTLFARAPLAMTQLGLTELEQYHSELGLAVDLNNGSRNPYGPFKFSPVWRQLSVYEQAADFKSKLDDNYPLISSQTVDGNWGEHYTKTFRVLQAAGFRADASYRAPYDMPGYAFGTGMPYMPIDTNGQIFNILEFPISFSSILTQEDADRIGQFLENSQKEVHACIGVSFDPNFFDDQPSVERFMAWKSVYRMASAHGHWLTGILPFFRFSRARFNAELQSKLSELTVNNKRTHVLRLETLAPETGMWLSVPKTIGTRTFVDARRGIQRVREDGLLSDALRTKEVSIFGFGRILLPLSKGFNAIDAIYE